MYHTIRVAIPKNTKKIVLRTIKGTTYVNYEYDRTYNPNKKFTNVKRTTIGKVCEDNTSLMYPNDNYYKYFPSNSIQPEEIDMHTVLAVLNSSCSNDSKRLQLRNKVKFNNTASNAQVVAILSDLCIPQYMMLRYEKDWTPLANYKSLDANVLNVLQNITPLITDRFIKGRISEFLFYRIHNIQYAHIVIDEYTKILSHRNSRYKDEFNRFLCSLLLLISKKGISTDKKQNIINRAIKYVKDNANRDTFQDLFVIEAIGPVDFSSAEKLYNYIILNAKENNCHKLENYYKSLIKFYKNNGKTDKETTAKLSLIDLYKTLAGQYNCEDGSSAIQKRHYLKMALDLIPDTKNNKEARNQLIQEIDKTGSHIISSMQEISLGPIDISTEMAELEKLIASSSLAEALLQLISICKLKSLDEIKEDSKKNAPITQALFSSTILDENGRTVCIVPPLVSEKEEDRIHAYEHYCAEYYRIALPIFIKNITKLIIEYHKVDEDSLFFLVERNLYVPEDRQHSVLKGLLLGFEGDFVSSMHILLPQFENMVRIIADESGVNTYYINKDESIEYFSLNTILKSETMMNILDETVLFNLRLFLTSTYGFGMRDKIAHSLLSDSALMSSDSIITWWFMLKIICHGCVY